MSLSSQSLTRLSPLLPWLILVILLLYTYADIVAPYVGFDIIPDTGEIKQVFANHSTFDLAEGDELVAVGDQQVSEIASDLRIELFEGVQTGEVLPLQLRRDRELISIEWPVPGPNTPEIVDRLVNVWWIGYLYWLAGTITFLFVRPKDSKYWLLFAFFMLTALWLTIGNTARWGHWDARVVYRMAIWLFIPVCLHLHWIIPRPLRQIPMAVLWVGYLLGTLMALLQWLNWLPAPLTATALAVTLLLSMLFLAAHYLFRPAQRPQLRILFLGFLFAALPLIGLAIASSLSSITRLSLVGLLALPLVPGAYYYSVYRYQLGEMELRANRVIALYLFLLLVGTLIALLVAWLSTLPDFAGKLIVVSLTTGLVAASAAALGFAPFQHFVERHLLAMPLPPSSLLETYVERITTSLTLSELAHLLTTQILPTLLVRQSALITLRSELWLPVYSVDMPADFLDQPALAALLDNLPSRQQGTMAGGAVTGDGTLAWCRLVLPMYFERKLIGLWLFGRRDPDDYYSPAEVATLRMLAGQTTLALANIEQAENLQALYKTNVRRHEVERRHLAHTLHDDILGRIALLYNNLDVHCVTPRFQSAYEGIRSQLRQMISGLRPAMLDHGLSTALEELAGNLQQRAGDAVLISLEVPRVMVQHPIEVEEHLFRIAQQACENALNHSRGELIRICGEISAGGVEIEIVDDGIGFDGDALGSLSQLLARKHYGIVGMVERAESIGAQLWLDSTPGVGTTVRVAWSAASAQAAVDAGVLYT